MHLGLKEITIVKFEASQSEVFIAKKLTDMLQQGWELLHISTQAPINTPYQFSSTNIFMYHFGKLKEN